MDPGTLAIISVVATVVKTGMALKAASQQKKDARRQAELQRQRLALEAEQRALKLEADRAQIRRQTRLRQAEIVNRAAGGGVIFSTAFTGAVQAVGQAGSRELNILGANEAINRGIDQLSQQTVGLNESISVANAQSTAISAGIGAVGDIAGVSGDLPSITDQANAPIQPGGPI